MKIIAFYSVWNCSEVLIPSLLSIHRYVDEIRIFDGAFNFMKSRGFISPHSTDGTKEIVLALAPKLACPVKWFDYRKEDWEGDEIEKRNFIFKQLKPDEWAFIVDSDEIYLGNFNEAFRRLKENNEILIAAVPAYEFRFKDNHLELERIWNANRFIKWQEGLHLQGCHVFEHCLQANESLCRNWKGILIEDIIVISLKWLRKKEIRDAQLAYESWTLGDFSFKGNLSGQ